MVRLKITLSIFFLSLLISCTKKDKDDSYNQTALLKNLSDNFISKGINDFEIQSIKLNLAVKKYLASKSDIDLENTQAEWKSSIDAWRVCELFNIGDIKTSFLFNRIDSWNTDTTDILLTLKDASIISKNTIELKPSNNVGLYALEYLLFENSLEKDQRFYNYLEALAENLESQTDKLNSLWKTTYKSNFENSKGVSLSASISAILNYQPIICEEVLRDKISVPLGYYNYIDFDEKTLEAWRSKYSLEIIFGTFHALKSIYYGGEGEGFDDYLSFIGSNSVNQKAALYFNETETLLNKINGPLISTLSSEKDNLLALRTSFQKIRSLFAVDIISSIGIMGTFSDIDGD